MLISGCELTRGENESTVMASSLETCSLEGFPKTAEMAEDHLFSNLAYFRPDDSTWGSADYETGYIQSIDFPQPGELRIRNVVSRSNARAAGKYPSWKMDRMIHWESWNERNAFRLLDCEPKVNGFREQPCRIVYVIDGVRHTHFPDILVVFANAKEIWEVKPRCEALRPDVRVRTSFLTQALIQWGYVYRIALGEDLAQQPRLDNANVLVRFGRKPVTDYDYDIIHRALCNRGTLNWSEACRGDYGASGRESLCGLALRGMLRINMDVPISPSTEFLPFKGGL